MLLGQRLNAIHTQIGQKIKPTIQLGQKMYSNVNKIKSFVNAVDNTANETKKVYSNLEKLNNRKRLL